MTPLDPSPSSTDTRPQRADARRNHDTILATARDAFAEGGSSISMAEIARRSGVGMATLYRNFPSRQSLLEALYFANISDWLAPPAISPTCRPGMRSPSGCTASPTISRPSRRLPPNS